MQFIDTDWENENPFLWQSGMVTSPDIFSRNHLEVSSKSSSTKIPTQLLRRREIWPINPDSHTVKCQTSSETGENVDQVTWRSTLGPSQHELFHKIHDTSESLTYISYGMPNFSSGIYLLESSSDSSRLKKQRRFYQEHVLHSTLQRTRHRQLKRTTP